MKRLAGKLVFPWRRQGRFLAVDFDSRQVRVVLAERALGGVKILKLAATEVPEGTSTEDPQALGGLLRQTLDRLHAGTRSVLMCVPRGQAVLKPLVLPRTANLGELAGMVQYQAEKELTFRPSEAVVDFTLESHYGAEGPPEEEAEGEHVLVAAVQQAVVDFYKTVAKAAGLTLIGLGMRPYANLRCVETYARRGADTRVAVVHITADEAEIDVFYSGGVTFSRPAVIKVPPAGTEPAAGDAAQMVVTEVTRSLHSYLGVEREHTIDAVLVAGGTGIEPRVAAELHRRLGITVEALDPAPALGMAEGSASASAFVSALGLAVCRAEGVGLPVDFLNPKRARSSATPRNWPSSAWPRPWPWPWAASSWPPAPATGPPRPTWNPSRASTGNSRPRTSPSRSWRSAFDTIEQWQKGGRNWLDQWAYLSGIFPPCTETYVTNLNSNPDGSIILKVKATSAEALDDLGEQLTKAGYAFKPGQVGTMADPYNYKYATNITVIVKPGMTVDLESLPEVVRPENDGSLEIFGRSSGFFVGPRTVTSVSGPPAPPTAEAAPTPTAARPIGRLLPATTSSGGSTPSRFKGGLFGGGGGGKGGGGGGKGGGGGGFVAFGPPEGDRHE